MNVGNPSRTLALAEAGRAEYLPVDDKSWEQGVNPQLSLRIRHSTNNQPQEKVTSEPLFISSSTNIEAAPFARLGQTSHLLSLVLTHIQDRGYDPTLRLEEAQQLNKALLALCTFLKREVSNEATRICVPIATCYSALMLLYEHCRKAGQGVYPLSAEIELQELGTSRVSALVPDVVVFAGHVQMILPYNTDQASPLVAHCFYRGAVLALKNLTPECAKVFGYMKETLRILGCRWGVAREKQP